MAAFPVHHGCHRDGSNGCDDVNFNHSSERDQENTDRQNVHTDSHKERLHPDSEQFAEFHGFQTGFKIGYEGFKVQCGIGHHDPGCVIDDALGDIEYRHDNVPCVRYDQRRAGSLEHPFIDVGNLKIVEIISLNDDLDKLQCHDKRQNQTGNRDDHIFGQSMNHGVHTAVPCGWRLSYLIGDVPYFFIDGIEQPGQVVLGTADKQFRKPFGYGFFDCVYGLLLSSILSPTE